MAPTPLSTPLSAAPRPRESPRRLLWSFALMSVASVATITLLVGLGVFQIYRAHLVAAAQNSSAAVAHVLLEQERVVIVEPRAGGGIRMHVADSDVAGLDRRLSRFLAPFGILKIKVYDTERKIVYSTDKSIVGKVDSDNEKLARVLESGSPDSKLVRKGKIADLHGQDRFGVDVVETYIPVRDGNEVAGSFEVYLDVSKLYESLASAVSMSLGVLFSVLVAVFGILFVPMWKGTARLEAVLARLNELAATDTLTGLFNRRYLLRRISEEYSRMERARRRSEPCESLGFIIADVDHFKEVNDLHGHAAGDTVLQEVAARLKQSARAYDVVGRYGGEEFLVMLPHTTLAESVAVAERMREKVAETPYDVEGKSIRVTVSFGVANAADESEAAAAVIRRADEGLYRAKQEGRDRVVCVT